MNYYDIVLALVPLSLAFGGVVSFIPAVSLHAAVVGGATLAALIVGHSMFVNPPRSATPETPLPPRDEPLSTPIVADD